MEIKAIQTRIFKKGDDLVSFVFSSIKKVPESSVVVVASKIVALAEGCTVYPYTKEVFDQLVRSESTWAIQTNKTWLTKSKGMIMAGAGVDESNGNGALTFLPKDPYKSAEALRRALMKRYKVKKLGIIISDSGLLPLRRGVIAQAIGYAGFRGLRDYVGKKDLFGRTLTMSATNIADSLATAGSLAMGEGNECQPLSLITNAPIVFTSVSQRNTLTIADADDMFYPLFKHI
jgi:coenzyme F420-0:L-glutamate ligase